MYDYGARNYDPALGRWMNIDALSELAEDVSNYHYANNNPVIYTDPTGLTGELATKYVDERGKELLNTNDGSDAVVTVKDVNLESFLYDVKNSTKERLDSEAWNGGWKAFLIGFELSKDQESILSQLDTDWARKLALKYWQTGEDTDYLKFAYAAALSQWTNPQNLLAAASSLAFVKVKPGGIVYLRTDLTGKLKPYVGQAKNEARYLARQAEHARANPNADFEFKVIDRGSASGKFPTSLDVKEQQALNKLNGPTNKSTNGGASNKKNVIKQ